jgi:hypothetical protein
MPPTVPTTAMPTTGETPTVPPAVVPPAVVSGVVVMTLAVVMVAAAVSPSRAAVAIIGTRIILTLTEDGPPPAVLSVLTHADALFSRVRLDRHPHWPQYRIRTESARQ